MTTKLAQLREHRNTKAQAAKALNDKFPADQRMPSAEAAQLDAMLAEIESIDDEINRETRLAQLAAEQTDNVLQRARDNATKDPHKHSATSAALRAYLQGGLSNLAAPQLEEMRARQNPDIRGAMSTTTNAEGGFTVAIEYMRELEQAMKTYGGMLEASTVLRTATGATMNFPTTDATSEEGEIVAQNTTVARLDTTFGNATVDVYKYSSKDIALPFELLQDSFIDIEAYIRGVLGMRLGRILNRHWTTGTGTAQPRGIVTGALLGKTGTTGQTLTVVYDDIVDLEHSINRAYRGAGFGFMMADSSLKVVRKIKDGNQRPIFVPGYEQGNPGGAPDRLLNRPLIINDDVPAMAANAKSILAGDFKKYVARMVMDLTLFRMTDSAFTRNGQVGFLAFQRAGGNLIDAGGAVKYYANSAT